MKHFVERLPMIPRIESTATDLDRTVAFYIDWELLELDEQAPDILIYRPRKVYERTKSKDFLILRGEVAKAWLKQHRKCE